MQENKLIHDKECIKCKKFFECQGKENGITCVNYQERKKESK